MAINRDAFINNFLDELEDNISVVDSEILNLKKDPEKEESLTSLLRALHTIKGSSRMLKFKTIESISHGLENVFKGVKDGRYGISKPLIQLVFITTDYLRAGSETVKKTKEDGIEAEKLLTAFEQAYADEPYDLEKIRLEKKSEAPPASEAPRAPVPKEGPADTRGAAGPGGGSAEGPAKTRKGPESAHETIRINVRRIENIVRLQNNLIIKQFQFRKENDVLNDLEERLRSLPLPEPDGAGQNGQLRGDIGECMKLVQTMKKDFSEGLTLLERDAFELQEEILSLRMLPLELVFGNLGKMVEETAMLMDKEINFSTRGTDLLLDKFILERLNDPIIHIVRNAVDHGIETPEEREAAGKPREGSLEIRCTSESGNIVIRIIDDGKGFDYEKVRKRAIEMFPTQEDEIREMDNSALNTYLFTSGFSTKDKISDLSGRGVGLDIVKHNIEKIKGKITLSSRPGEGSEFKLALPLSLATVDGFFVSVSGEKFLIPSTFVKEIIIVKREDELDLLNRKGFRLRDMIIPLYPLKAILDKETDTDEEESAKQFVVVVESLGEIMGIVVESVIQYTSLIYKPVPKNLGKIKLIQGIVFDESFNIVNILFIPEIMKKFKRIRNIDTKRRFSGARSEFKRILVVDDSYSTREIEKSILELENYNVGTAVDGIDGLEKIKEQKYHLIITDIHMPRMDGLTFVENLRKDDDYKNTPVIVVSSDENPEKKMQFEKVGANAFIIKSEFDRGNLIKEVKEQIG